MNKIVMLLFIFTSLNLFSQTIPVLRTADWSSAGYPGLIPTPSTIHDVTAFGATGNGITDDANAIRNAIDSLHGSRGVVYLPAGNYLIGSTIDLPDSVILRGESADSTHIIFDFAGNVANGFNITGGTASTFAGVTGGAIRGSDYLVVDNSALFIANGYVELMQNNGSWDTQPVSWADNSVGQILHISGISGDTLFLDASLRINYDAALNVRIRTINPAVEVGIECMHMSRIDTISSGVCINIYFSYAANCWVHGVESSLSIGSHIEADASTNISIKGCYIHHSFLYDGVSTHGYGITLFAHTGQCLIENNIMQHLRHSFSMQTGANGNVIAYNYSFDPNRSEVPANYGADISMHGHFSYINLFEGNVVQNIQIDQTWGPSGPFNTFFRNRAELYGILMTSGTVQSDSLNFVGNEVPNTGFLLGNYIITGNAQFEFGNNIKGTLTPAGTSPLPDSSYFLSGPPAYCNSTIFPSIGIPNAISSGSNPARDRYLEGVARAVCNDAVITSVSSLNKNSFEVFPNPSSGKIAIHLNDFQKSSVHLLLKDIGGKEIFSKNITSAGDNLEINLPGNINNGIYILEIVIGKKLMTKKIVILR